MKRATIAISENGWEYTGYMNIACNDSVVKTGDNTLLIDNNVTLEFDEDIVICEKYHKDI